MQIIKEIKTLQKQLGSLRKEGRSIGFVPTMGALHKGHLDLLKRSKKECDITVCSIFVNPTQFNDKADFDKYPITIEADTRALTKAGCDILFLPSVKEMYPTGFANTSPVDFGFIADTLEGEFRPGHFDGVAQIVDKLLKAVKPDKLFMGQKDYQQVMIVGRLIKKKRYRTELVVCPTTREKDGLAMSSRNRRLDKPARKLAVEISKTLKKVKASLRNPATGIDALQDWGFSALDRTKGIEPEYFVIRNAETLEPAKSKKEKLVALVAAKVGGVRLIDNWLLN